VIRFFDASALVKRYVREAGSPLVAAELKRGPAAVSRLSLLEITSALCRRCRQGDLTARQRDRLLDALRDDARHLLVVEVTAAVVDRSSALLRGHDLRAGDAIQLASGLGLRDRTGASVTFVAFDDRLRRAALREGLEVPGG
jgi:predicted nucleic acid-binding protein